jgi:uncharacterized protein (TIRG00374 family)
VGAVGLSAIFFLPARLGEAVRPLMIADSGRVRTGEAIATVVVERLVDGLLVGLMLIGVGAWVGGDLPTSGTIRRAGWIVGGIFLALTLGMLLSVRFSALFCRVVEALFGRWPRVAAKLEGLVLSFRDGLVTLSRTHHVSSYLALSVVMWIVNGLAVALLFEAFGMGLPVACSFVVLSATAVGILVPAAPTSLGTIHFAAMWALGLYGIGGAAAFDFAVVFHLGQVAANLAVGVLGILGGGLTFERVRGAAVADAPD